MPLFEYACDNEQCGDLQEVLLLLSEYESGENVPNCETCGGPTHRIYLPSHIRAAHFDPIVYHQAPDGRMRFPGRTDSQVPEGFERKEVRTMSEYEKFRRKVDRVESSKIEEANEGEHAYLHYSESVNRPELRAAMQHMTPQQRRFAELAIEHGNRRPKTFAPNFYVEAMEFDASNREAFSDGDRHGRSRK